ncbi:MAG: glycerol-3-phosphate 1-O-acyltransferase PlsY [Polyangia bacterium]
MPSAPVVAVVVAVLCGYLLGSIPFGLLVARLRNIDLRSVGSGNIGATNAARALGKGWGVLVLGLDAAKAAVPILAARHFFRDDPRREWIEVGVALAAFLGHLFPVFAGFRGGKGVATAFGSFVALAPLPALLGLLTYALLVGVTRISSVGSICAVLSFPIWLRVFSASRACFVLAAAFLVMILLKHRGNIARLWRRQEQRV